MATWLSTTRATKGRRRWRSSNRQFLNWSSWMVTIAAQTTVPTASISTPTSTGPCPVTNRKDVTTRTAISKTKASRARRQAVTRIGHDHLQVDGDTDEHQSGEDRRDPCLGQKELVPLAHLPPTLGRCSLYRFRKCRHTERDYTPLLRQTS